MLAPTRRKQLRLIETRRLAQRRDLGPGVYESPEAVVADRPLERAIPLPAADVQQYAEQILSAE
ncbi:MULTISPECIES: hypothetical protein [Mycobacteroides]|uniref:hypothetical protein n=1 Tax=Mycobacteroides TaxID=670516 RepID=UPI00103B1049|nr:MULTISPECIES: hypothetical protein [Mycobacteroides]MDO2989244.1 hypothetical protein [Mycobacteroides abscessus subsp. massiliense]WJR32470.1 hypothetical protein P3F83_18335 [Mycobacteroides immunogenum]